MRCVLLKEILRRKETAKCGYRGPVAHMVLAEPAASIHRIHRGMGQDY